MTVLTAWEGMPVRIPQGVDGAAITARVLKIAESLPFPAFRVSKGKLCAAEVVGTVQVGSVRINVLPKTDKLENERDADFLVNILRVAGYLRRAHTSSGDVRSTVRDPLEVMISEVVAELSFALKDGIPRRYQAKREDSKKVRGQIDFKLVATRLPSELTTLPVKHTPLTIQNDLAYCLLWLATTLSQVTRSSSNRQHLIGLAARLRTTWNGGRNVPPPSFAHVRLAPSERRWERVLSIARLLANGRFVNPTYVGSANAFMMLFPLQHLFERAMRTVLVETLRGCGVTVKHKTEPIFLLRGDVDGEDVLRLKPDFLFYRADRLRAVVDAKWKRLSEVSRAHGVRREDFYQVNAYLDMFDVESAVVLVPQAPWMSPAWTSSYTAIHNHRKIHLVALDIERLVSHRSDLRIAARNSLRETLINIL